MVMFIVCCFGVEGDVLVEVFWFVELFLCNQWGGFLYVLDMVVVFVQFNDFVVDCVLKKVVELFWEYGKDVVLDGYSKGGVRWVWELVGVVWGVVVLMKFDYVLLLVSFEYWG